MVAQGDPGRLEARDRRLRGRFGVARHIGLERSPHGLHFADFGVGLALGRLDPNPLERSAGRAAHLLGHLVARSVHESGEPLALVERYDAVKFGIFQRNLSNFRGLVLFCIEADFCNQILIF